MATTKRKPNPEVLARQLRKLAHTVNALSMKVGQVDGQRYAASVENAATALHGCKPFNAPLASEENAQ